jgi:hypothetical protein
MGILESLDIHWQVKQSLILLITLNDLRNQFVVNLFSIHPASTAAITGKILNNPQNVTQEASVESMDTYYQENLVITFQIQCTMIIHMIDLMIQSFHHLLSPIYHLQRSEYPELERIMTIIHHKHQLYSMNTHSRLGDHHLSKNYKTQMEIIQKYKDSLGGGGSKNNADIFPLTQPNLTTDLGHGVRRGTLLENPAKPQQQASKANPSNLKVPSQYMNRSGKPRRLPANVDHLLDILEQRNSSSRSPSPVRNNNYNDCEKEEDNENKNSSSSSPKNAIRPFSGGGAGGPRRPSILAQMISNKYQMNQERPVPPQRKKNKKKKNSNEESDDDDDDDDDRGFNPKVLTSSVSDSILGLPQNHAFEDDKDNDQQPQQQPGPTEEAKKGSSKTRKPVFEPIPIISGSFPDIETPLEQSTALANKKKQSYQHHYWNANKKLSVNSTGLKSLFSHSLDGKNNHTNDNPEESAEELFKNLLLTQPSPRHELVSNPTTTLVKPADGDYFDFTRMKFDPDFTDSNAYGGKLSTKLHKTSPRPKGEPIKRVESGILSHLSSTSLPAPEDVGESSVLGSIPVLKEVAPPFDLSLTGGRIPIGRNDLLMQFTDTTNTPQGTASPNKKSSFSPAQHNHHIINNIGRYANKNFPVTTTNEAFSLDLTTVNETAMNSLDGSRVLESTSERIHSKQPLMMMSGGLQPQYRYPGTRAITTVEINNNNTNHNILNRQPQAPPAHSRPSSASTNLYNNNNNNSNNSNNTFSRGQKALRSNEGKGPSRPNTAGKRNISAASTSSTTASLASKTMGAKYYVPTIQAPLFDEKQSLPSEKIRIIVAESTEPASPRPAVGGGAAGVQTARSSSSQSPRGGGGNEQPMEGLAVAGKRANTSANSNREKVTNAVLSM